MRNAECGIKHDPQRKRRGNEVLRRNRLVAGRAREKYVFQQPASMSREENRVIATYRTTENQQSQEARERPG
jgi:hypothetical protein